MSIETRANINDNEVWTHMLNSERVERVDVLGLRRYTVETSDVTQFDSLCEDMRALDLDFSVSEMGQGRGIIETPRMIIEFVEECECGEEVEQGSTTCIDCQGKDCPCVQCDPGVSE